MAEIQRFGNRAPKDGRLRNWTIIIYEDSCPDWRDVLSGLHVPALVSPLHDKDVRADGTFKKPHRHVILMFSGKKSIKQVQEVSDMFSGTRVLWEECAVGDLRGMVRYLVHFDDANKAQYDLSGIECYSGADYLEHFQQSSDVDACVGEMMEWLDGDKNASFSALSRYARDNRPDWFRVLTTKRTVFISAYAKAVGFERRAIAQGWECVRPTCIVCGKHDGNLSEKDMPSGEKVLVCEVCEHSLNRIVDEQLKDMLGEGDEK